MSTALPMPLPTTSYIRGHSSYSPSPLSSSPVRPSTPLHTSHQPRQTNSSPLLPSNSASNPFSVTGITTDSIHSNYYPRHRRTNSPPRKRRDHVAFSKRPIKFNPLLHSNGKGSRDVEVNENSRETRRKLFLKRVREDSEDKRWKDRGGDDELLRTIWIAEERRRSERKEREGDFVASSPAEEEEVREEDSTFSSSMRSIDERMADEAAQQEDEEMEAMLSLMRQESRNENLYPDTKMEESDHEMDAFYGSDDDEYENLLISAVQAIESENSASIPFHTTHFPQLDHGGGDEIDRMDES